MKKFAKFIANHSVLILVISFLLLVPAIYGYVNTRINYDILVYLPDSVDTIKGENILTDDFGLGAYAFVMVDSSNNKKMLDFQTIAVDFDGTLCYSKWPELGQPNQALIEYLQEWGYAFVLILAFIFS